MDLNIRKKLYYRSLFCAGAVFALLAFVRQGALAAAPYLDTPLIQETLIGTDFATAFPHALQDPTRPLEGDWLAALRKKDGNYFSAGQGTPAALSFAAAHLGGGSLFYNGKDSIEGALLGLASNAHFTSVGANLRGYGRLAIGSVKYNSADFSSLEKKKMSADGAAITYTTQPLEDWTLSFSNSFLREKNTLSDGSAGETSTAGFGFGAVVDLGDGYGLGMDAIIASTGVSHSISGLKSTGFSIVFDKKNRFGAGDDLGISVKKPLDIYSGSSTGHETDVGVDYKLPLAGSAKGSLSLSYRQDADNVAGARDAAALVHFSASF